MEKMTSFKVSYGAKDNELSKHSIDAEVLGKSILSMSNLINKADDLLNDGNKSVKLLVTCPAQKGSLGIDYTVIQCVCSPITARSDFAIAGGYALCGYGNCCSYR